VNEEEMGGCRFFDREDIPCSVDVTLRVINSRRMSEVGEEGSSYKSWSVKLNWRGHREHAKYMCKYCNEVIRGKAECEAGFTTVLRV
jgi:hypothetical protein